MLTRILGKSGLKVSALGLGCMGMSMAYGKSDDQQSVRTLQHAIDIGITLIDSADIYGDGHNETLIASALRGSDRNKVILATKCGLIRTENYKYRVDGSPEYIQKACENSLKRLKTDIIDLYYLHRADRRVPIEESVGALAKLIQAGKIRHIGLSEVTSETLRRAAAIHPITALQSEYSLWHRKPEKNILGTCRDLGIGFVPYSPLGRGFLTGKITETSSLAENDFRRVAPRFQAENFQKNLKLVEIITDLGAQKKCTPAQLALAWVLAQGEDIVPIPGTRSITRLEENINSLQVSLSESELADINQHIPIEAVAGEQYPEGFNLEV